MTTKADVLKAIRSKCMDCCCDQYKEVELCTVTECPLHPYRFGKDPNPNKKKQALGKIRARSNFSTCTEAEK